MDRAMDRSPGIPSGLLVPDGIRGDGNTAKEYSPPRKREYRNPHERVKRKAKSLVRLVIPGQLP